MKKLKVVYDNILFSLQKSGGISVYWTELSKSLKNEPIVEARFLESANNNLVREKIRLDTTPEKSRLPLILQRITSCRYSCDDAHIFHSSYYRTSRHRQAINVVTVHDFTHELLQHNLRTKMLIWQKRRAISKADGLICQSENTKRDLLRFYPEAKAKPIKVIYSGVLPDFHPDSAPLPPDYSHLAKAPFALFTGSRARYKNFALAVQSVSLVPGLQLVITGGGPLTAKEQELLDTTLPGRAFALGFISNQLLNALYNHAQVLLYLSEYEGFGLPVAEALRVGCPVITTNRASLPEVAGRGAILLENLDPKAVAEAIQELASNHELRAQLLERGARHVQQFTWDATFRDTLEFYHTLFNQKQA